VLLYFFVDFGSNIVVKLAVLVLIEVGLKAGFLFSSVEIDDQSPALAVVSIEVERLLDGGGVLELYVAEPG